jgi:hypothetical protein
MSFHFSFPLRVVVGVGHQRRPFELARNLVCRGASEQHIRNFSKSNNVASRFFCSHLRVTFRAGNVTLPPDFFLQRGYPSFNGVGKKTTTVSLAAGLAASGHGVARVDCDPQARASTFVCAPKKLDRARTARHPPGRFSVIMFDNFALSKIVWTRHSLTEDQLKGQAPVNLTALKQTVIF